MPPAERRLVQSAHVALSKWATWVAPFRKGGACGQEPRMSMFAWKVVHGGRTPPPGAAVAPDERLSWSRTVGLGAQHVVAMFGATFVFPIIMGLNPQCAIMMSGIATIAFLLIVQGKVPSYLGTSAAFVGGTLAIYAQEGTPVRCHRGNPRGRCGARGGGRARPCRRTARAALRASSRGHRCRRDVDRIQPGTGCCQHLLAPGPVDRPSGDAVRHRGRGRRAWVPRPDRDLPRAAVRLLLVLGVR